MIKSLLLLKNALPLWHAELNITIFEEYNIMKNHKYFFIPRKGVNYEKGRDGIKTLIVGIAHICDVKGCEFREKCANQDSIREMDRKCPAYKDKNEYYRLSNSNEIEITSFIEGDARYPAYKAFTCYMLKKEDKLPTKDREKFWESVAFTNYLQFFLDNGNQEGLDNQMFSDAYDAFLDVLDELQPQVIYVWNKRLGEFLKAKARKSDQIRFIGLCDMKFQLNVYFFTFSGDSCIDSNALRRLRNRHNIPTLKHGIEWYRKLVKLHLKQAFDTNDPEYGRNIEKLAELLQDFVNDERLEADDHGLSFPIGHYKSKASDELEKWTVQHKALFIKNLKLKYGLVKNGMNKGLIQIFKDKNIPSYSTTEHKKKDDSLWKAICMIC